MAISRVTYSVLSRLVDQGGMAQNAALLELGEANWYGDLPAEALRDDLLRVADPSRRQRLSDRLEATLARSDDQRWFELAKLFYAIVLQTEDVTAIDLHGTANALRHDLNGPVSLPRRYDVCINNGTAEHVFFAGQVFATMHAATRPGGLMIHEGPLLRGWYDHGFFTFQPTLFWDVAAANGYRVEFSVGASVPFFWRDFADRASLGTWLATGELPADPVALVVFEKPREDADFVVPMQGAYAG